MARTVISLAQNFQAGAKSSLYIAHPLRSFSMGSGL